MGHLRNSNLSEPESTGQPASGFSPIEILMATTLLAIVLATYVPEYLSAGQEARRSVILKELHTLRGHIEAYCQGHDGHLPAEGTNSSELLLQQLTERTDAAGAVLRVGSCGPYLRDGIPPNPYSNATAILTVPAPLEKHHFSGTGGHGWVFSSTTGEFRANVHPDVTDGAGRPINQY